MIIRPERPGDERDIATVIDSAFASAEHSDGSEAQIVGELRATGALTISLVAEEEAELLGQIAFSLVFVDGADLGWFGLGPVAVFPDRQGRGIGSWLIRDGLAMLRNSGASGCVLVGDPAYYGRFGFRSHARLIYPGIPPEYFQALPFGCEVPTGTVAYHPAFG